MSSAFEHRRTKIIATVGPASRKKSSLEALIKAGVDVFRLNMSHGSGREHGPVLRRIRDIATASNANVAILMDLSGPKIRVGELPSGGILLRDGARIRLDSDPANPGTRDRVGVNWPGLFSACRPGSRLLLDDGNLELQVESTGPDHALARVLRGGNLTARKGLILPGATAGLPTLTEKDHRDLAFGVRAGVDLIAVSFVNRAQDLRDVRAALEKFDAQIPLVAKIETALSLENLEEITEAADGIMVARGDLGIETPIEEIPLAQKRILRTSRAGSKPCIVATQILESMIERSRPTRAEVTDIANAVLDGADALMLSAETAVGKHPVEATHTLRRTIERVEPETPIWADDDHWTRLRGVAVEAFGRATRVIARDLGADAIMALTTSGRTARCLASFLPSAPILAAVSDAKKARQLAIVRGVFPVTVNSRGTATAAIRAAIRAAQSAGFVSVGDLLVITAGTPTGLSGSTNTITVQIVGGFYLRGYGAGSKQLAAGTITRLPVAGKAPWVALVEELTPALAKSLRGCVGVISARGGPATPGARLAEELGIPAVLGIPSAGERLTPGDRVTLDSDRGLVRVILESPGGSDQDAGEN